MRAGRHSDDPWQVLGRRERVLHTLVETYGRLDPFNWPAFADTARGRFPSLVLYVISQQISTAAARSVFARLESRTGRPVTPVAVGDIGFAGLRQCGLSGAKSASLTDLASRVMSRSLDLDELDALDNDEAGAALTAVRGVGPWTAHMFLIHQLRRADVFPAGDLGIRTALRNLFALDSLPSSAAATELARGWSPFRTYAAALLWASL